MSTDPPPLVLRRAADRFVTRSPGIETRHGFSFGPHYDPQHVAHGRLVVHDEHVLEPGAGFAPHPHHDLEIVSWVLEGELVHEDGPRVRPVPAGVLQWMTAGTGVVHAERAGSARTRFLQLWLTTRPGLVPSYEQVPVQALAEVLPGWHAGRLDGAWALPEVPRAHLHVAAGTCALGDLQLSAGDAVRLAAPTSLPLRGQAEVLLVELAQA